MPNRPTFVLIAAVSSSWSYGHCIHWHLKFELPPAQHIMISPPKVDYGFSVLPSRTTSSAYNNINIHHVAPWQHACIVGIGSANISHNGAVAQGNVKGRRLSKGRNACFDDVKVFVDLVIFRWSHAWPQNSNTTVNFLCLHCKSLLVKCPSIPLSTLHIVGRLFKTLAAETGNPWLPKNHSVGGKRT